MTPPRDRVFGRIFRVGRHLVTGVVALACFVRGTHYGHIPAIMFTELTDKSMNTPVLKA